MRKVVWAIFNIPLLPFYALALVLIGGMWLLAWADPRNGNQ